MRAARAKCRARKKGLAPSSSQASVRRQRWQPGTGPDSRDRVHRPRTDRLHGAHTPARASRKRSCNARRRARRGGPTPRPGARQPDCRRAPHRLPRIAERHRRLLRRADPRRPHAGNRTPDRGAPERRTARRGIRTRIREHHRPLSPPRRAYAATSPPSATSERLGSHA